MGPPGVTKKARAGVEKEGVGGGPSRCHKEGEGRGRERRGGG